MSSRTENVTRNIGWGFVNRILLILLPFVSRTILIYTLGIEYVGLGSLFASLLGVMSLAELGIGSALVFSMYRPFAEGDSESICALLALYRKCYRIIGAIILGLGLVILPFLPHLIEGEYPADINLYVLYMIYLSDAVIGYFFFAYKQSVFVASQRTDIISNVSSVLSLTSSILQIALLLVFHNYYLYILVLPMITCVRNVAIHFLFGKRFPELACSGSLSKIQLKQIKQNIVGIFTQKLGNVAMTSTDAIIISAALGLVILGKYNNYYYIAASLIGFMGVIQGALVPSVGNSIARESLEKNYTDFRTFLLLYVWLASWWTSAFLILVQPFISLWIGDGNLLPFEIVVLLALYFYLHSINDMTYIFREAAGIWRKGMLVPMVAAIVNVIISVVLVRWMGLSGVILGTIISLVFVYTPFYTRVLFTEYFHDTRKWVAYLLFQLRFMIMTIFTAAISLGIASLLPSSGIISFLLKALIAAVVPNTLLFLFNCRAAEYKAAKDFGVMLVKRKFGRRSGANSAEEDRDLPG